MKVVFVNSKNILREIGQCSKRKEAFMIINKFLDEHDFKSYYMRTSCIKDSDGNYIWIDVGSWSEFFRIYPENDEEWLEWSKENEMR